VRDLPDHDYVITEENNPFDLFKPKMEFEEFIDLFAEWFNDEKGGTTGSGIGAYREVRSGSREEDKSRVRRDLRRLRSREGLYVRRIGTRRISVWRYRHFKSWIVQVLVRSLKSSG